MNNFNDYYDYLNSGFSDMNYMTNPNSMIGDLNYQAMPSTTIMPKGITNLPDISSNSNIVDTYDGFKRGNMFDNLYDGYKNYKPEELKAGSEREDLIMQIDEQRFAMIDLGLYLDIYPNDRNALSLFNTSLKKEKELITLYESKYGPMTLSSPVQTENYLWIRSPWPWEVQK